MREFEKKFCGPSYVPVRFFAVARERYRRDLNFFPVSHVLHQNETTAG
jgi:hypothetical protein